MAGVHVLLCPGALEPDVDAVTAARVMATAWRTRAKHDVVTGVGMSHGSGDVPEVLHAALGGDLDVVTVPGALGEPVPATVLRLPEDTGAGDPASRTAVVDAAEVIGDHLLAPEQLRTAVLTGTSEGVGRLLRAALATGAARIVVAVGPSAVHDGGVGLLHGLGLGSARLARGSAGLGALTARDLAGLRDLQEELRTRDLVVAYRGDEPLVGLHGAGATLVRRVGLDPMSAQDADRAVAHVTALLDGAGAARRLLPLASGGRADRTPSAASRPGTGAGGGVALVLAHLGARLREGTGLLADLVGLAERVARADLVVTACGRLDADAVRDGLLPTVARTAAAGGVPVVVVAREVEVSRRELARIGVVGAYALGERPGPYAPPHPPSTRETATDLLARRTRRIAATWSAARA
jgi:glycerate kinase